LWITIRGEKDGWGLFTEGRPRVNILVNTSFSGSKGGDRRVHGGPVWPADNEKCNIRVEEKGE